MPLLSHTIVEVNLARQVRDADSEKNENHVDESLSAKSLQKSDFARNVFALSLAQMSPWWTLSLVVV